MTTKTYVALHSVKMDGKSYSPGELIAVPEKEVERLLAVGAIADISEGKKTLAARAARTSAARKAAARAAKEKKA